VISLRFVNRGLRASGRYHIAPTAPEGFNLLLVALRIKSNPNISNDVRQWMDQYFRLTW
jgi:hypothetical protein